MPSLDSCLNSIYEPGFIPGDSGLPPTVPVLSIAHVGAVIFLGIGSLSAVMQPLGGTAYAGQSILAGSGRLSVSVTGGIAGANATQFVIGGEHFIMLNTTSASRVAIGLDSFVQGF